jgi:hypothetical protein
LDFIQAEARAGCDGYFYNPAVQFNTTVTGSACSIGAWTALRDRHRTLFGITRDVLCLGCSGLPAP